LEDLIAAHPTGDVYLTGTQIVSDQVSVDYDISLTDGRVMTADFATQTASVSQVVQLRELLISLTGPVEVSSMVETEDSFYLIAPLVADDTQGGLPGTVCHAGSYCTNVAEWSALGQSVVIFPASNHTPEQAMALLTPTSADVQYFAVVVQGADDSEPVDDASGSDYYYLLHAEGGHARLLGLSLESAPYLASLLPEGEVIRMLDFQTMAMAQPIVLINELGLHEDNLEKLISSLASVSGDQASTNYQLAGSNFAFAVTTAAATGERTSMLKSKAALSADGVLAELVMALNGVGDESWRVEIEGDDFLVVATDGHVQHVLLPQVASEAEVLRLLTGVTGQFKVTFGDQEMIYLDGKLIPIVIPVPTGETGHQPLSIPSGENVPNNSRPTGCAAIAPVGTADLFQIDRQGSSAVLYFTPVRDYTDRYHVTFGYTEGDERFGGIAMSVAGERNNGVLAIEVNNLDPGQAYSFKVVPVNDCAVGTWSNWLSIPATSAYGSRSIKSYRYGAVKTAVSAADVTPAKATGQTRTTTVAEDAVQTVTMTRPRSEVRGTSNRR